MLASINRIETAFGTNLNVSTAGALGWMQFMPATWEMYGVDANGDGRKDPYNPVDAICAAARYLKAAGGEEDLYRAIFAYNHADWYVDEVLLYAKQYGSLPSGLIDSLVGLTEGAHFPVAAKARYADDISEREAIKRATPKKGSSGNVSDVISDSPTRRGIDIFADEDAPVVAVNDGVIKKIGKSKRLGNFIKLQDAYGNLYTYAELGSTSKLVPVPEGAQAQLEGLRPRHPRRGRQEADDRSQRHHPRRRQRLRVQGRRDEARPQGQGQARRHRAGRRPDEHRGRSRPALRTPRAPRQPRPRRPDRPARLHPRQGHARIRNLQVLLLRRPALQREDDGH